ncbi:MAG: type I polyketide synthase, partial [Chloroflexota bacterium]
MAQTKETIEKIQLRRAIQAIEQMKAELVQIKYQQHEPIAIIGMGCRYPGGPAGDIETPEEYWIRLLEGFDGIVEMSEKRRRDIYGPHKQPNRYALHGGYLAHIDQFDPLFFGISPREALVMDPVHRLLLETTWHALEDANIVPKTWLNHEVGVFIGTAGSSGHEMLCVNQKNLYAAIGHASSTASGRISYLLGLTGPCVSIDTACSSSLVAVHQACQSLRNGECKAALAGGVGVLVEDAITEIFGNSHMLADDAHCKTFDADAGGYVRSEGCGIVVLKRLSDSQRDDDNIIAVIRGTSINQDGPSGGIAVPNGPSQRRVIQRALDDARLTPTQIGYVEAHGIGSPIGDSIEMGALDAVFKDREHPLYVGSVKTNLGHLECAAGIAGFMKLALAVQDGQIPPHLHFHTPSPYINWDASSVQITTAATPWTRTEKDTLRIGGVSAFGYSGSNAHVIVSESPDATTASPAAATIVEEWSFHLLTISAKHEDVLSTIAQKYADYLQAHPDINLGDLCYTSHVGRSHFDHRLALTASSAEEMQRLLTAYTNRDGEDTLPANISQKPGGSQTPPHIAFLFTDVSVPPSRRLSMSKPNAPLRHAQGAERLLTDQETLYVVMGQELYETAPTFRDVIDRCDAIFQEVGGCSLVDLLYLESGIGILARNEKLGQSPETDKDVHAIIGAAIFAMQCALIELWRSWGITPDVVLGHGVGDFAAAYAAGVMSLEDGVRLVTKRDQLMETLTTNCSPLPDPILDEFEQAVQSATLNPPNLTVISSTTGKIISDELSHPPYWRKQLRKPIGMDDALTTPHKQNIDLLIKIGPNSEELIVNSEELIVNSGELIVNSGELIVN